MMSKNLKSFLIIIVQKEELMHWTKNVVYSTGRRTRRWPFEIFYRLLDISSLNLYVLYNSFKNNKTMTRADYLKSLAFELVSPELESRFENTCISREIRSGIGSVLSKSKNLKDTPVYENKLESRKTC